MSRDFGESFNVAHIEPESHIYGPGKRFVIWLQGCSLACEGCWNQQMWSFKPNQLIDRQALLEQILASEHIDGITVLGGEPLQQPDNLVWLLQQIRSNSDLNCVLYSGYEQYEIEQQGLWPVLETACDLMILGRYEQSRNSRSRQWTGSDNQTFYYPENTRITQVPGPLEQMEIIINDSGAISILGYPDSDILAWKRPS
jgi:anaerobic ribonucleoside-triphosphate reductase activating protein